MSETVKEKVNYFGVEADKLTDEEIKTIKKSADENFDGDVRLAVAAHIYGYGVVLRVGRKVAEHFDKALIANLKTQITKADKAGEKV